MHDSNYAKYSNLVISVGVYLVAESTKVNLKKTWNLFLCFQLPVLSILSLGDMFSGFWKTIMN